MPPKPPGYWEKFSNVKEELLAYIKAYGEQRIMPSRRDIQKYGFGGLVSAIGKHGGTFEVARKLGLKISKSHRPSGY